MRWVVRPRRSERGGAGTTPLRTPTCLTPGRRCAGAERTGPPRSSRGELVRRRPGSPRCDGCERLVAIQPVPRGHIALGDVKIRAGVELPVAVLELGEVGVTHIVEAGRELDVAR